MRAAGTIAVVLGLLPACQALTQPCCPPEAGPDAPWGEGLGARPGPRVAVDDQDGVYVLWGHGEEGELLAVSRDDGATWLAPQPAGSAGDLSAVVAGGPGGRLIPCWSGSGEVRVKVLEDQARTRSAPLRLDDDEADEAALQLVLSPVGLEALAWVDLDTRGVVVAGFPHFGEAGLLERAWERDGEAADALLDEIGW